MLLDVFCTPARFEQFSEALLKAIWNWARYLETISFDMIEVSQKVYVVLTSSQV